MGSDEMASEESPDQNALVPSPDAIKAKLDKAAKLDAEILDLTRAAYDPADKLSRECKLGRKFIERAKFQRDNTTDWNKRAYSDLASKREEEAKLVLGVNDVRMDVSAKVAAFVDWMKPGSDLIDKVPYYRIANFFLPMFEWDCVKLTGEVRADWVEFLRSNVADNAKGKDLPDPISIADLRNRIDAETKRQAELGQATKPETGPDDKQGKALERAAAAAAKREKNRKTKERDAARDGFTEAAEALRDKGDYSAADMAKHFLASAASCGVELTTPDADSLTASSLDVKGVRELMQALFDAGKVAEIAEMVKLGQQMIGLARQAMKDAA
jgi:hypothetical protein